MAKIKPAKNGLRLFTGTRWEDSLKSSKESTPPFFKKSSDAQGTKPAAKRFKERPVKKEFALVLTVNNASK